MRFTLKYGEQHVGKVRPGRTGDCNTKSTTLDLHSACEQIPLHESYVNKVIVLSNLPWELPRPCEVFWVFKYSAEKLNEPGTRSKTLGVELVLADSDEGVVSLRNKEDRVADVRTMLDKIICEGMVKPHDLPSRLGRTQFRTCK